MRVYLTYNDLPSGVYKSQVVDVVKHLNQKEGERVRLVAFVSIRGFLQHKKKIQSWLPDAVVLPMVPGVQRWEKNAFLLRLWLKGKSVTSCIARGVFATLIAQKAKIPRVTFDGRGAYAAEWEEFDFGAGEAFRQQVEKWEKEAVHKADMRIAVSHKLVDYWKSRLGYEGKAGEDYVVIPCTLNEAFLDHTLDETKRVQLRKDMNIPDDSCVLVYSGSAAGWQSFASWSRQLETLMQANSRIYALLMTEATDEVKEFLERFPDRSQRVWVNPNEVAQYLSVADYGILIRDDLVTNRVASPTKFAEYLACGLDVLVSPYIGDYPDFVNQHNCGQVIPPDTDWSTLQLEPLSTEKRLSNRKLALEFFVKKKFF